MATIVGGTGAGLLVGGRLPERARTTMLQGVGLVVIVVGVTEAAKTRNVVFPLVAIVAGGLVGELLRLEERLESLGERIRRRVERDTDPSAGKTTFVEGFVAASLIYCVGPLAILGSIQDGLRGDISLLVVKSSLDGLVSIVFAATLGWGVGFSALAVAAYQGTLTLLAGGAQSVLSDRMVLEMTATGGIMVMGIGFRLLEVRAVRVGSLLPALAVAPALVGVFAR